MNELSFPETTKYVIVQQATEGLDTFTCFVVEPQHQFSSGNSIVGVFDSEEEAKATFPQAFRIKKDQDSFLRSPE